MFPLEMPIDDDEFTISIDRLKTNWHDFRDGTGTSTDEDYLRYELGREECVFFETKNQIQDLEASTEAQEEKKSKLISEMDNWYNYKKNILGL